MAGRFQFSIRFLLAATVAVAAAFGVARANPSWQEALAMDALTAVFLTAAIIGAIQTSGGARAFWIGTAVVLISAFYGASENAGVVLSYLVTVWNGVPTGVGGIMPSGFGGGFLWVLWCVAPVNGLLAVFLHWLFRPRRNEPG